MLDRIADLTWRRPKLVLAGVGAFTVLAASVGSGVEHHLKAAGFTDSASESERATKLLRESLGYDANPGIFLVVRDPGGGRLAVSAPAVRREVDRLSRALAETRHVGRVVNPLENPRRSATLIGRDGRSVVISGHLSTQDVEDKGGEAAEDAKERLQLGDSTLDVSMGGFAPGFNEVNDQTREDLTNAELIAFPALTVLLLLVFRGVIAAAIPLLMGVISILGTFLVLRVMSLFVDTSLFALNIATALSLGLAVDYALLLVSRYREEIERDGATREAHRRTVMTAGRTALFSGFTVAAAMAALILLPQRFLYSVGAAGAAVGLLSAATAILVVPSILALLGTRINKWSVRQGPSVSDESGGWYRLARGVMRRPVAVALASSALLLAASVPLLSTVLTGPSAEAVPPGQPSFDANTYVERHYPRDISEAITVTVHGAASRAELAGYAHRVAEIEGIRRASPFARGSDDVAYANFAAEGPALRRPAQDSVDQIRSLPPPAGTTTMVSGNTARFIDQKQSLRDDAPMVIAVVGGHHADPAVHAHGVGAAADQGAADERPHALGNAGDRGAGVPGGLARQRVRLHRAGGRGGHEPGVPVRGDLRPGDRLRRAGDGADQGAARPRAIERGGRGDRDRPHRPGDHGGGADDRRGVPRVRGEPGVLHEADRRGDGGRRAHRRDDRARAAGAVPDAAARRPELVGPGAPAAVAPAGGSPGGLGPHLGLASVTGVRLTDSTTSRIHGGGTVLVQKAHMKRSNGTPPPGDVPDPQDLSRDDQTLGDDEQTLSDSDQTLSDRDQTLSDRDQDASDEDQAASDRQHARDVGVPGAHDHATAMRAGTTKERQEVGHLRDETANQRDQSARKRDSLAAQRDRDADIADERATAVEKANALSDRHTLRLEELRGRAAEGRKRAASNRERAQRDRRLASRDRELAARDREQARLDRERAGTDELTGARRRGVGVEELRREVDRARREHQELVVAYVDIDGLKAVNDKQGHAAGDELLREVVEGLKRHMRSYDLVVRLGGDEFLCVLPGVGVEEVKRRLNELSTELALEPAHGSLSIGVCELKDGERAEELIERADRTLIASRRR